MAYQFWDGFDNYSSSTELWDTVNGSVSYSGSYARFAAPAGLLSQGMKCNSTGGAVWKQKNLLSNQQTMIFGFAIYITTLSAAGGGSDIMQFMDSGSLQCRLSITSSGQIALVSGGGSGLATSASGVITGSVWYWLDVELTIGAGSGSIAVYVNQPAGGSPVLNASGLNNRSTSDNYINAVRIGDFSFGGSMGLFFDDFHAHDNTGSAPNAIIGDSRIYTKVPNAAGYSTQWTPTGASANWQCVDDSTPDGDTTYVSSNTPGQIDGYAVPLAGFTGTVNGVVRRSYVRKDDASAHTFQNGVRSGSTNALGTAFSVGSTYSWTDCGTCYVNDPATSSPWTVSAADAATPIIDETS